VTAASSDLRAWLAQLTDTHTAATPGPWIVWHAPEILAIGAGHTMVSGVPSNPSEWVGAGHTPADTAAIVASHNAMPVLLGIVGGLLDLADELERESAERKQIADRLPDAPSYHMEINRLVVAAEHQQRAAKQLRHRVAAAIEGAGQ
jgi:hypothetical protein